MPIVTSSISHFAGQPTLGLFDRAASACYLHDHQSAAESSVDGSSKATLKITLIFRLAINAFGGRQPCGGYVTINSLGRSVMSTRLNQVLIPVFALMIFGVSAMRAQQTDPSTALTAAHTAMIGSNASLRDITLTGDVEYIAGSTDEHGTITMMALADGSARFDIALPKRTVSESVFVEEAKFKGQRKNGDEDVRPVAAHNLMVGGAWFWPALLVQRYERFAQAGEVSSLGLVQLNGQSTVHLRSARDVKSGYQVIDNEMRRLSRTSLFFDPVSFQPVSFAHETHLDQNSSVNIAVESRYSEYKIFDGIAIPMHIERYVNGVLHLDIHINAAQINTGLDASQFRL